MENRALVTHFSEATAPIHTEIQVIYKSTYQELLQEATWTIWFSARFQEFSSSESLITLFAERL